MFENQQEALGVVKDNLGLNRSDQSRDGELNTLLNASQGTRADGDPGTSVFRPYIIAAYLLPLWGAVSRQQLIAADGAKWLKPEDFTPLLINLLNLQKSMDCGLDIPECWTVDELSKQILCGCTNEAGTGETIEDGFTPIMSAMLIP